VFHAPAHNSHRWTILSSARRPDEDGAAESPTESDRWSQRDTLATGHGRCRDNRQQATAKIGALVAALHEHDGRDESIEPLPLHGFGCKAQGLMRYADKMNSAESQAWALFARMNNYKWPGCRCAIRTAETASTGPWRGGTGCSTRSAYDTWFGARESESG
jgi:hypothetical protein